MKVIKDTDKRTVMLIFPKAIPIQSSQFGYLRTCLSHKYGGRSLKKLQVLFATILAPSEQDIQGPKIEAFRSDPCPVMVYSKYEAKS
jgi:hypothetical protein